MRLPPEHMYATDERRVRETRYSERYFARAETAFSLSNGYVGIRGTFDERRPALSPGTFRQRLPRDWTIVHAEAGVWLARTARRSRETLECRRPRSSRIGSADHTRVTVRTRAGLALPERPRFDRERPSAACRYGQRGVGSDRTKRRRKVIPAARGARQR